MYLTTSPQLSTAIGLMRTTRLIISSQNLVTSGAEHWRRVLLGERPMPLAMPSGTISIGDTATSTSILIETSTSTGTSIETTLPMHALRPTAISITGAVADKRC